MIIIPAIDIINKMCVRLTQGDYEKVENYRIDPLEQAKRFESQGAKLIHIVDLDGAKLGKPVNFEVIKRIKQDTNLTIECGGGIRDLKTISDYFNANVDYLILGSVILKNFQFVKEVIKIFGNERFIAALDFQDNYVKISGWVEDSQITLEQGIEIIKSLGIKRLIYTDINTDGMLSGHNLEIAKYIRKLFDGFLISSGGISSLDDIVNLKNIGADGVIIGKALYTGKLKLDEVLKII